MKSFSVRYGIPREGFSTITVLALDAAAALLFAIEAVPAASFISVRPA